MVFNFYNRLTSRQQSIYRQSDDIKHLTLKDVKCLHNESSTLETLLIEEDLVKIEMVCQTIADDIVRQIKSPRLKVQVLSVRPSDDWGELHGLYLPEDDGQPAKIQVWMRTAKNKKVVAFKSFLRTLLHELCHHIDYEHFGFPETFHTAVSYTHLTLPTIVDV